MRKVAKSQDLIPWKDFMEGKLSVEIFKLQHVSLACSPSLLTLGAWSRQLTSKIFQMLHVQWVFHNISLHDNTTCYLRLQHWKEVLQEVDYLSQLNPGDIPERSRYRLEINFTSL